MRRIMLGLLLVAAGWIAAVAIGLSGQAQTPQQGQPTPLQRAQEALQLPPSPQVPGSPLYNIVLPAPKLYRLEDAFLRWPLPAGSDQYGAIDGRLVHPYVVG